METLSVGLGVRIGLNVMSSISSRMVASSATLSLKEVHMPKKWIQGADLKKGAFTQKAEKAGKSVPEYAKEKSGAKGVLGKEARLAQTFEKMKK